MKQSAILIGVALLFVLINGAYIYYLFNPETLNIWETRYYIGYGIIFIALITFGVLRIYNAIVVNSRYLRAAKNDSIKLSAAIKSLHTDTNTHTAELKKLRTANNLNKSATTASIDKLRTSIDNFVKKIR